MMTAIDIPRSSLFPLALPRIYPGAILICLYQVQPRIKYEGVFQGYSRGPCQYRDIER